MILENRGEQQLISVIVPVYNVAEYLPECVDSIINQTYKNLEIILVDDGSTDACPDICDEYAKRDSRIRVIHKENGGLSDARNAGLDICTGEWIGFVDSDDYISPFMYEKMYAIAIKNSADVVACYATRDARVKLDSNGSFNTLVFDQREKMIEYIFLGKYGGSFVSVCVKLYKKHLFDSIRFPVGRTTEDGFIVVDLINITSKMVVLTNILYYYRVRIGSITNARLYYDNIWDTVEAYKYNLSIIQKLYPSIRKIGEIRLAWAYRVNIGRALETIDAKEHMNKIEFMYREAQPYLLRSFINPYMSFKHKIAAAILLFFPFSWYLKIKKWKCKLKQ